MSTKQRNFVILGILVGLVCVVFSILYALTPAGSLPSFLPGYEAGSLHIHVKHSIAAFLLGIGSFLFAWFQSGSKPTRSGNTEK